MPASVGRQVQRLGVVIAQIGYLYARRLDVANLVAMIHYFAGPGHEYIVSVSEKGLDGLIPGLGVAKVFQIDGGCGWLHGRRWGNDQWSAGVARRRQRNRNRRRGGLGGENVSSRAGVFHVLA